MWNSEGFGDPAKHRFVIESIREHRLDFIALLETDMSNFTVQFFKNLAAKGLFVVFFTTTWTVRGYPCRD